VRLPVGDRYVIEKMREGGFNVGGEHRPHHFQRFITRGATA
jgi:phosphomannomutase